MGFPDTLDELAESLTEGTFAPALATGLRLIGVEFRSNMDNMRLRTPRQLGIAASICSPAVRRARTGSEVEDPTAAKTLLVLSEMPSDALDKIFCRLDSPDMVSLCCTCKATQRAVSADWLWRAALARDFPTHCVHKLRINQSVHPQRVYAATFSQIVDITRMKTRARFEPERIQSNSFVFALPNLGGSNGQEDDHVAIPQPVSHLVLAKAIEGLTCHVDRTRAQSFNLGFLAHGLATLEGIRCVTVDACAPVPSQLRCTLCCISLGFMDALHTLQHQGHSTHYWHMWMQTFRLLCDTWVDVLSEIEEIPYKLRDKYLVFAFFRMEWQRNADIDSDADDLQTVGHWDTITVPLNRLVPTRVADRLAVAASAETTAQDEPEQESEQEEQEQEQGQQEDEEQQQQQQEEEEEEPENFDTDAAGTHVRIQGSWIKKQAINREWALQEHARLIQRLESTPGIGGFSEAKAWRKEREAATLDVRHCPL
jgi:hypothetical protein